MAQLPDVFKSKDHKAMDDFSPAPDGDYTASIVESEMKDTKAGTGKYLNLKLKISGGDENGRMVYSLLNLVNPNPIAVEIAQKEMKSICDACGKATVKDSMELHGIPMIITLGTEESEGYPPKNVVKNYKPAKGGGSSNPFKK